MRPGHLSIHVGDGLRCSEEIVKNLDLRPSMRLLLLLILLGRMVHQHFSLFDSSPFLFLIILQRVCVILLKFLLTLLVQLEWSHRDNDHLQLMPVASSTSCYIYNTERSNYWSYDQLTEQGTDPIYPFMETMTQETCTTQLRHWYISTTWCPDSSKSVLLALELLLVEANLLKAAIKWWKSLTITRN